MINYTTDDDTCTTKEDLKVAQEVAQYLGIKLHTFDLFVFFQPQFNLPSLANWSANSFHLSPL